MSDPASSNDQCVVQCSWIDACTGRRCVLHQGHAATGVQGGHDVYGLDTSDLTPEREIDRLVAARTGPGRPMVQRPNEAPTRPSCASCAGPVPGKYCTSCVMSGRASAHDRQELTDEIERLRVVIKTGGAMYRAERLALECGMGGMPPDEPRTQEAPINVIEALRALVLMHDEGYTRAVAKILGGDYEYERNAHGANGMAKIAYAKARAALAAANKAEARVAELEARDANGLPTHCVDRATWDEMGRELAAAANERDEALARVAELETAICRHVRAREGESDERPDMTVALLYRIEHGIKAREARTAPSVSTEKESK